MLFWGKIFGAFLGVIFIGSNLVGHLSGMILGVFLGHICDHFLVHYFDQHTDTRNNQKKQERQECFFYSTFSVMGHIAKTKKQVTKADIQVANVYLDEMHLQGENAIQSEYSLLNALQTAKHRIQEQTAFVVGKEIELLNALQTTKHRMQAHSAFSAGKEIDFSLAQTLSEFSTRASANRNLLQMFLCIQLKMAYTDGQLNSEKKEILYNIGEHFGFPRAELNRLLRMIEGQQDFYQDQQDQEEDSEDEFYKILGITKIASEKEIKRAYRKLMNQYHPDKLASKDLSDEMMKLTKEKAQYIQSAYEALSKAQGLK
jgi:DnaJ like chaperone protein